MPELNISRYADLLRRLLLLRGTEGSPLPEVSPELQATVALEVDRLEWGYLSRTEFYSGGMIRVPAAGQTAEVRLRNPSPTDKLVVLQGLQIMRRGGPAVASISYGLAVTGTGGTILNSIRAVSRDSRFPRSQLSAAVIDAGDDLPFSGFLGFVFMGGFDPVNIFPGPALAVIAPNHSFTVSSNDADTELAVMFHWYERPLEPSEV